MYACYVGLYAMIRVAFCGGMFLFVCMLCRSVCACVYFGMYVFLGGGHVCVRVCARGMLMS